MNKSPETRAEKERGRKMTRKKNRYTFGSEPDNNKQTTVSDEEFNSVR